jgi:protein Tex
LRSFGQLKQLWQARVDEPGEEGQGQGEAPGQEFSPPPPQNPPPEPPPTESTDAEGTS